MSAVRFEALSDGVHRALFAVRETSGGDLIVTLRGEKGMVREKLTSKLIEYRVSVHQSKNSNGTTINTHNRTEDGIYRKYSTFIHNTNDFLLWPIMCRRCPDLSLDQYKSGAKTKDKIVLISDNSSKLSTLLYTIFVSYNNFILPDIMHCSKFEHSFTNFKIAVYTCYVNLPPLQTSAYVSFTSSAEERGKEPRNRDIHGFINIEPINIANTVQNLFTKAAATAVSEIFKMLEKDQILHQKFGNHRIFYTKKPTEEDNIIYLLPNIDENDGNPTPVTWMAPFKK